MKSKLLILIFLLLPMASARLFSVEAFIDEINYYIDLDAKTAVVSSNSSHYSGDIVIPSTVDYEGMTLNVTGIGYKAFLNCVDLTSVKIPGSVTDIRGYAFDGCINLTSIIIPNSVTSIGDYSFLNCKKLSTINIPESVNNIGISAFQNCTGLVDVSVGNSVKRIGERAFDGCRGLVSITIGKSVTSIGFEAFQRCYSLTSVHITDLKAWCEIAFEVRPGEYNYSNQQLSNPLACANHLFLNGEEIIDLLIPNDVTTIGSFAFVDCTNIASIFIPNSVISIGQHAFSGCIGLTSVSIGNGVTSMDSDVFSGCTGLTSVNITDLEAWCKIDFKGYGPLYEAHHLFLNGEEVKDLVIPDSVTSIGNGAFMGCTGLTSVTIGNGVTDTHIGSSAFSYCNGLTHVSIGNSVTNIDNEAFSGCSCLSSIAIGNRVNRIGNNAFDGCDNLTSVHINDLEAWSKILFESPESNPLLFAHHLFLNGIEIKDLVIPNKVTCIGASAFCGCTGLTSITIPGSVTRIGANAFEGCSSLTSTVILPGAATSIGPYAFLNCSSLTSFTIPNSVTSIGIGTFQNCTGLTSITVPGSVTSIGDRAFCGCTGLTSITLENGVDTIGYCAIADCFSLTSITIPASVSLIIIYAFASSINLASIIVDENNPIYDSRENCNAIIETASNTLIQGCKTTVIPNSVTRLAQSAFDGCSNLVSVSIPKSVSEIDNDVFHGCNGLQDVYCFSEEIPKTGNAFRKTEIGYSTLHVPEGSVEQYKQTSPWSGFGNIVALTEEEITGVQHNPSYESFTRFFDLSGKEMDAPSDGVTIVVTTDSDGKQKVTKRIAM